MVVETDWPEACSGVALSQPAIPASAAGQQQWVLGIRNVLSALSGGHGLGIAYWEPAWVSGVQASVSSGFRDAHRLPRRLEMLVCLETRLRHLLTR